MMHKHTSIYIILAAIIVSSAIYKTYTQKYEYFTQNDNDPTVNNEPSESSKLSFTPVDSNNALILAQTNAGNINYIKQRLDGVQNIKSNMSSMQSQLTQLQQQVNSLAQQQVQYGSQISGGGEPANISGLQ